MKKEINIYCKFRLLPEIEGTYRWNDPVLAIDWGIDPKEVILSARDAEAPAFPSSADIL